MNSLRKSSLTLRLVKYELKILRSVSVINVGIEEKLKSWNDIPGPSSLPFIGQMLNFLPGGMLYKSNEELAGILYRKYRPIVKLESSFGSNPMVFLYDPEAALQIFRNENWMPVRPGFQSVEYYKKVYNKNYTSCKSTGLITDHGKIWKKLRIVANSILLQSRSVKLHTEELTEVAKDMVKRIKSNRNEQKIVGDRFDDKMYLWALEFIGVIAVCRRLNCFDTNLPDDSPEGKLIQLVHNVMMASESLDFQPSLWRYIATPKFKKGMRYYGDIIKLSEYFVNKAIEQLKLDEINKEKGGCC